MGSRRSPRAKHRFGFSGAVEPTPLEDDPVSDDDILESLTRRAEFGRKLGGGLGGSPEPVLKLSEQESVAEPVLPVSSLFVPARREYGKYAFALMLVAGMAIVLVAGAFRMVLDTSLVGKATQTSLLTSVFTDPVKLALVALLCLIPAVLIRRSRRARERLLFA